MDEERQLPQEEWSPKLPWLDRRKGDMTHDIGSGEEPGPYIGPERILSEEE